MKLRLIAATLFAFAVAAPALAATFSPGTTGLAFTQTDADTSVSLTYFSIVQLRINPITGTTSIEVCGYVSQAAAANNPEGCVTRRGYVANAVPASDPLLAAYNKLLTLPEFSGAVQVGSP